MAIGETIDKLTKINIQIWHEATKIKDIHNNIRNDIAMTPTERVNHFFEVRKLNAERSKIRWETDKYFKNGADETKINFYIGDK